MESAPRRKWLRRIAKGLLLVVILAMFLRWFEHAQVYFPMRQLTASADALGRPAREVFFETTDGERLHAWFFPARTESPRGHLVVLHCHGNAGNISHRLDTAALLLETGVAVLLFDYRGYGRSTGSPGEEGTYRDADAACRWLMGEGFAATNIIVFGESLGGGVAADLAAREQVGGLILQSTFTSIPDIGAELFPWLPVRLLSTIRYDTQQKLPRINAPVLVMHGRADEIIGFHHGERNFAAANEPKLFHELAGGHNDWIEADPKQFLDGLERFLQLIETGAARPAVP
jgi:uncharacterized protein